MVCGLLNSGSTRAREEVLNGWHKLAPKPPHSPPLQLPELRGHLDSGYGWWKEGPENSVTVLSSSVTRNRDDKWASSPLPLWSVAMPPRRSGLRRILKPRGTILRSTVTVCPTSAWENEHLECQSLTLED